MATRTDSVTKEKLKKRTALPNTYNVIMLNDDKTPMEWVVGLLQTTFRHSSSTAEELTMTIHTKGSAVVGTYVFEIAEQKSVEATQASRSNGFPLQIKLEEA